MSDKSLAYFQDLDFASDAEKEAYKTDVTALFNEVATLQSQVSSATSSSESKIKFGFNPFRVPVTLKDIQRGHQYSYVVGDAVNGYDNQNIVGYVFKWTYDATLKAVKAGNVEVIVNGNSSRMDLVHGVLKLLVNLKERNKTVSSNYYADEKTLDALKVLLAS